MPFAGAKLALFIGARLAVIRRDDIADIPWPDYLDLPGGGREGRESPLACALRETQEELGLTVPPDAVVWGKRFVESDGNKWFFAAHLPETDEAKIVLGDEGQSWQLMAPQMFIAHPKAVPQFQARLALYMSGVSGDAVEV
nr:NUDIX hydrolase [Pseudosulfitobacter sp. DSM 107133]